jgi:acyl carrier protein
MAWGLWSAGMADTLGSGDQLRLNRSGVLAIPPERGLRLYDAALSLGRPAVVPALLDLAALRRNHASLPSVLREIVGAPKDAGDGARPRAVSAGAAAPGLVGDLAALTREEGLARLLAVVRGEVAAVLGHQDAASVGAESTFKELGADSLSAVELRNRLGSATGLRLPTGLIFDHPTPTAVAHYLHGELAPGAAVELSALAQIERLEAALAETAADPQSLAKALSRLEGVLWKWSEGQQAGAAPQDTERFDGDRFRDASDDELFDALDGELGIS